MLQLARRAVAHLALLVLAGCVSAPPPQLPRVSDPRTVMPALEVRIFELVNEDRTRLAPGDRLLTLDPELTAVAREKSIDMATRNYTAHAAPDGTTSATIIMARDASFHGLLGENLAAQPYWTAYGVDVEAFANRVIGLWVASKPHRENLTDPDYARTGIGAAASGNTVYVTALFSGPRDDSRPEAGSGP